MSTDFEVQYELRDYEGRIDYRSNPFTDLHEAIEACRVMNKDSGGVRYYSVIPAYVPVPIGQEA